MAGAVPSIGQVLGHYRLLEQVGSGGMGIVFRAHDERLNRDVAVKVLPPGTIADESARKRFRREALTIAVVNHANIATVYDFDTHDGVDFLVMELIPGTTLDQKLSTGVLSQKSVLELGAQIADGLAAAHAHGVVHRDLKPGNLRITRDGWLKILDFGLAKLLRPATAEAATESVSQTGDVGGTLPYMAPEQLLGEGADARADIHAIGALLYEMATGKRPFSEVQSSRLIDAILHGVPVPPRALNPRISPGLEAVILKCLEKEPEDRYQSARELSVDLRRLAAPSAAAVASQKLSQRSRLRRRIAILVGSVLAVLAVLVGVDVGGWRHRLMERAGRPKIQSLAVLPLTNLSGDPQQEYFADGMTEELITELSRIGALKVISRTSVMQYKGAKKPLPEIARELGVDGVVTGSVEREGGRVRITAQLTEGRGDRNLWAQSYQRDLRNVLALEDEVARAIASEIKITVTPQEQSRLARSRTVNPEAYVAYLKGNYHAHQLTQEGMDKGLEYFQQAIALDPNYAEPYDAIAYDYLVISDWTAPPKEVMPKAKAAAKKAIQLDDTLAQAHADLASVYFWYDYNFPAAENEFKRATELNPNDVVTAYWYGWYLTSMGKLQEGAAKSRQAIDLAPLDLMANTVHGLNLYYAHQYQAAIQQLRATIELQPSFWWPHVLLGWCYEQVGKLPEAMTEFHKARQLEDTITEPLTAEGRGYALAGNRSEAMKVIEELRERAKRVHVSPYDTAIIFEALGQSDNALAWLEKAYEERSWYLASLSVDPRLDRVRSDPHFRDLIRRIGFPP